METSIKFDELDNLSVDDQIKSLVGAINNEFKKPLVALMLGKAGLNSPNIKFTGKGTPELNEDMLKSATAKVLGIKMTPSANPILTDAANDMAHFYHTNMPDFDMGFTLLFDLIDMRNSNHDHFDIADTNAGITFNQRKPGAKIEIRRSISEAIATVKYLSFSDGLGILDDWLKYQKFWKIDEAIAEFRSQYWDKMAGHHYQLLTALGSGINTSFDTDDTTTLNAAVATILRAVRKKGYGTSANSGFYIVCAPEKVGRMERMITAQRGSLMVDFGTVKEPVSYRINGVIASTHIPANDSGYYLVLPGKKNKRGVWKDLEIESARNIYTKAEDMTGDGQYNAAIGDSDQIRRVLYS